MTAPDLRFVLLRPRNPENVGAAARALKNFGFADAVLVDPAPFAALGAERLAVHARDVLARMRRETLGAAVADCSWVVGTTSRLLPGRPRLTPRAFAEEVARRGGAGPVALLFGDERSGLRRGELERCHDVSCIPTSAAQPSVNLAQSVLLYAYELRQALAVPRASGSVSRAPSEAERDEFEAALRALLLAGGFLRAGAERHALRDLQATLQRAQLSRRELRLWRSAVAALAKSR